MEDEVADFGLFGPDSVAWKVHAHPSGWIGAIRALLLQALEPRAMAGVAQFSRYSQDPWRRFSTTSEFIMTVTYRPTEEAVAAIARVRMIHDPMVGTEPYTNRPFSANDPYLLAYIHNCLVDSVLVSYLNFAGRLSLAEQDQYVSEMYLLAKLIGADTDEVPKKSSDLTNWLASPRGLLLTDEARLAAWTIENINLPAYFHPVWKVAWQASLAVMPSYALDLYGFEVENFTQLVYKEFACAIAWTLKMALPSHPYYRQAKYAYYDFCTKTNQANYLSHIEHLLRDLSTISRLKR